MLRAPEKTVQWYKWLTAANVEEGLETSADGGKGGWIEVNYDSLIFKVMTITTTTAVCGEKDGGDLSGWKIREWKV